jgi:hypothetical protein
VLGKAKDKRKKFFFEKKLSSVIRVRTTVSAPENQTEKSFLLLFLKKEVLPFPCLYSAARPGSAG